MVILSLDSLINLVKTDLLPNLKIASIDPHNPVEVLQRPDPWQCLGAGNYAAVFYHPDQPNWVVKVYAPGRPGFDQEVEVYRRLGVHPAFSECLYAQNGFLILKRLYGITLYDCVHQGVRISRQVIHDIDQALDYARQKGLYPHDVHGRNVMLFEGRGFVVDVSDFLHPELCTKWQSLKQAYFWFYRPLIAPLRLKVPYFVLDIVRKSYRCVCQFLSVLSLCVPLIAFSL